MAHFKDKLSLVSYSISYIEGHPSLLKIPSKYEIHSGLEYTYIISEFLVGIRKIYTGLYSFTVSTLNYLSV